MKLKKIIFCMKAGRQSLQPILDAGKYLSSHGIEYEVTELNFRSLFFKLSHPFDPEVLYLSEDNSLCQKLLEDGYYVIGLMVDEASDSSFPGTKFIFTDIDEIPLDSYNKAWQRLAHLPWEVLKTKRCVLREMTVEDLDSFYAIYSEPSITEFLEPLFEDRADEEAYTRDYIEKVYGLMGFGVWTVLDRATGQVIGRAGFSIRNGFDNAELGFLIGVPWQGQGYATEICKALLAYAKNVLEFPQVQAFVKKENEISIHLLTNLGFVIQGEVDLEEDIYGESYENGSGISLHTPRLGHYLQMSYTM